MSNTLIVVPCFNESQRLRADSFGEFASRHPNVRFLFVNDGSTDDTLVALRSIESSAPERFSVLELRQNSGKAEAVRRGMLQAFETDGELVGFWDVDLATPLDAIIEFEQLLHAKPELDMVFGSRVKLLGRSVERSPMRHYAGRVLATATSLTLGLAIYDTQCGAKLFRATPEVRSLFRDAFVSGWMFDVEIIARLIRARRLHGGADVARSIYEYPLTEWRDVEGSKVRPMDFPRAFLELLRIWRAELRQG